MPAGTGVWVVNTVPDARTVSAVSKRGLGLDPLADALQTQESRVALVGVEDVGLGMPRDAQIGADRPDPADADQHLLLDPLFLVAAVEPVGDVAQVGVVLLDVGVQQQQRHPPDLGHPDPGLQLPRSGHRQFRRAPARRRRVAQQPQRQPLRIQHRVVLRCQPSAPATAGSTPTGTAARQPMSGRPRSEAALRWSPARMPRPPE